MADKVMHHDPSFGYNTAAGYIEEDSVQALEQIVSEQFGVGRDADKYWREQDGGMHVLAVAIYNRYKAALKRAPEAYGDWFIRAVEEGELRGDKLQATNPKFFSKTPLRIVVIATEARFQQAARRLTYKEDHGRVCVPAPGSANG